MYEAALGVWPAAAGLLAELRVNGAAVTSLGEHPSVAQPHHAARGLCHVTLLSLGASDRLSLAVEHSPARTKAYLGLRKL